MAEVYSLLDVLEGPEVEIGPDDEDDIDSVSSYGGFDSYFTITMSGSEKMQQLVVGAGPSQDIYEVDQILDGPKKRREYNYQKCYKIRWKNFGKEADSWQPVSDLENVMYMVREFNRKRTQLQKKKKPKRENRKSETERTTLVDNNNIPKAVSVETDSRGGEESEVFGNLKDRFWKKLEMGLYDETVFDGDMYSKVKGSRRAAHADAATNIQKIQQHNHRSPLQSPKAPSTRTTGRLKWSKSQRKASKAAMSSPEASDTNSIKPEHFGLPRRSRKRSSEPFSARGYMSAKRSRRSREQKRPSVSSITLGIVSRPQTESAVLNGRHGEENTQEISIDVQCGADDAVQECDYLTGEAPFHKLDSEFGDDAEDTTVEVETKMTVTSETMLTVTTETKRLDVDNIIQPEEIIELKSDENFLPDSRAEDLTSAAAQSQEYEPQNCGYNEIPNDSFSQRSTLDSISEASGAVERSHSEECLWGGACNRSDCKSNRRWNMKNGKGHTDERVSSSSSGTAPASSSASNIDSSTTVDTSAPRTSSPSNSETQPGNSLHSNHTSSSNSQTQTQKPTSSSNAGGHQRESSHISSSYSQSVDSTPGRNVSIHLKRTITGAFDHMEALSQGSHKDVVAGTSSNKETGSTHNSRYSASRSKAQTTESDISSFGSTGERPGLFSDNSSFNFRSENSSVTDLSEMPPNPSPSGSLNLSSPGKENFSRGGFGKNDHNNVVPSGQDQYSMSISIESDSRQEPVSSSSEQTSEMMDFISSTDGWPPRKRGSENSQPLEKIPSPNSRRVSDLDQRVLTNTCDELEDMEIQGEEHKDKAIVTNADLLQAVNLNKGEVVRRAIKQSSDTIHKLDFEQPDSSGLTLLMRAVNKSSIAIVEMLIENGANVNAQQVNGITPLMVAVEQREICVVALLLKYGANSSLCTISSDQGDTALKKAIRRQNKDAVSLMLRTGVNFSSPECENISALDVAIERRNSHIEALVRSHIDRTVGAFEEKVLETLQDTAQILDKLFQVQCFPLRESQTFTISFKSSLRHLSTGEGYLLFIAHTKITDKGVRCRFHGTCPIASVTVNGVVQSPLTKEVNFVTSCHPVITGCNTLEITKHPDYLSKAKLLVCAYRARLLTRM